MKNAFNLTLASSLLAAGVFIATNPAFADGPDPVTVVNTPLPVRIVNPPTAPSTVNIGNVGAFGVGRPVAFQLDNNHNPFFTVPLGQRLIMEYLSGICTPDPLSVRVGQVPRYFEGGLQVITGGFSAVHFLNQPVNPIPSNGSGSTDFVQFGHLVKIYADPGTAVTLQHPGCVVAVSGQLVPQ